MTRMSPNAKALLASFRSAEQLDAGERERMTQALLDKVARGEGALPGIDASMPALPEVSWWAKLFGSVQAKLGLGVITVAVITAGTALLWRGSSNERPALRVPAELPAVASAPVHSAAASSALDAPQQVPRIRAAGANASAPVAPSAAPARSNAPKPSKRVVRERARVKSAPAASIATGSVSLADSKPAPPSSAEIVDSTTPSPASEPPHTSESAPAAPIHVDAELGLLRRAYSELNAGHPAQAFDLLDEHAARFPHGALEQAREVARMLALCAMGRERAARVRAQSFLAAYPGSAFEGRVRGMCPQRRKQSAAP